MNMKVVVSGVAALALVLGGYAYREPLTNAVTGLIKGKPQSASGAAQPKAAANSESGSGNSGRKGRRGGGAVSVAVGTVETRSMPQMLNSIGSVQAFATVGVKTRVDGQLYQSFFQEGQAVKKGQKLFRIDPRPFEVALRQAQANLARDRAQYDKTTADLARYQELVNMGYASRQKFEEVRASNAASRAVIAADEAAVDQARLQLEYTTIYSPITGRTGNLLVSVGNLVRANDQTPLVTITQTRPIYVSFSVPERYLLPLKALMAEKEVPVEAMLTSEGAKPEKGKLSFVNNVVDVATGTIQLKATFSNDDETLTPGAFVNLMLVIRERPNAIVIPTPALQAGQSGSFVWVVRDNETVEVRPVTVDETTQSYTVISAGLQSGEKVVTDGQLNLTPGARVRARGPGGEDAQSSAGGGASAASTEEDAPKKKRKKKSEGNGT